MSTYRDKSVDVNIAKAGLFTKVSTSGVVISAKQFVNRYTSLLTFRFGQTVSEEMVQNDKDVALSSVILLACAAQVHPGAIAKQDP